MPHIEHRKIMLCAFMIALVIFIIIDMSLNDDDDMDIGFQLPQIQSFLPQVIGDIPPKDIYAEIYNTAIFKHYTGIKSTLFDHIESRLSDKLYEARNIQFEYDLGANKLRKKKKCKISNRNRIINFLHQMRTGQIIWDSAYEHGWNICSASVDFFHVLFHFVNTFYDEWVQQMSDEQKENMMGMFDGYPFCYQALDGSQFLTTKSVKLPDGVRRREVYCWKHRWPQGKNVQTCVSHYGHATEVMIGPGAANDSAMSRSMCGNDGPSSTLVDDGYPERDCFILPDGSDQHTVGRTVVERYFARLKVLWKMVGGVYTKGKRWHDLVLRAAFILTNMVILWEGGLNRHF